MLQLYLLTGIQRRQQVCMNRTYLKPATLRNRFDRFSQPKEPQGLPRRIIQLLAVRSGRRFRCEFFSDSGAKVVGDLTDERVSKIP